jgi:hypothetical protein
MDDFHLDIVEPILIVLLLKSQSSQAGAYRPHRHGILNRFDIEINSLVFMNPRPVAEILINLMQRNIRNIILDHPDMRRKRERSR